MALGSVAENSTLVRWWIKPGLNPDQPGTPLGSDPRPFWEKPRSTWERFHITRAYFRELQQATNEPKVDQNRKPDAAATQLAAATDVGDLAALLREAEIIAAPHAQRFAALTDGSDTRQLQERDSTSEQPYVVAPLFERALSDLRERDPELFSTRVREVGYLANVWIAGGAHEGRSPRFDGASAPAVLHPDVESANPVEVELHPFLDAPDLSRGARGTIIGPVFPLAG